MVSFTPRPLYPWERIPLSTEYEANWFKKNLYLTKKILFIVPKFDEAHNITFHI